MRNLNRTIFFAIFVLIIGLFCYFRLKPIFFQTVPYTYDQGRDFLKAREIIHDKHLPFIGPTTGIQGVFHGAWWYYYLALPYLIFQGHPSGFPLFTFVTFLVTSLLFFAFIKNGLDWLSAFFFLIVVATSPYLIQTSFFVSSTFPLLPLFLLLFYSVYKYFEDKTILHLFLIFFTLGMLFETEVAAGLMVIPAFLLTIIVTRSFKKFWPNIKFVIVSFFGILIPLLPRILFELKNHFLQSRAFLQFTLNPTKTNTTTFKGVLFDRAWLFWHYYLSLFPDNNLFLAIAILVCCLGGIAYSYKKLTALHKNYLLFFSTFLIILFAVSLGYRNNFFWANYLEGLPLIYLILLTFGIHSLIGSKIKGVKIVPTIICSILLIFGIVKGYREIRIGAPTKISGMREQILVVESLYKRVNKNDFCLKVYTPPVIPYTYNYLFDYYSDKRGFKNPGNNFDPDCWYIIEKEPYLFRVDEWRKQNTAQGAILIGTKKIDDNVSIEHWIIK